MTQRNNLQAKYDDLTKKYMESKVASGLEKGQMGERFTLIDAARLPEKPVCPNIPAILLIGLVLGIGAGVGSAALKEFSDQSVRTAGALSSALGLPVLAVIPDIVTAEDTAQDMQQRKANPHRDRGGDRLCHRHISTFSSWISISCGQRS